MTTETQTTETVQSTPQTKTLESPDLSFSEYETLRRGGKVEVAAPPAPEAKPSEQKPEASASETPATEEKVGTEPEARESEEDTEPKDEAAKEPKSKKSGMQKRFDKLTAQKAELEREREYWKQEALKKGQATETKPAATETPKATPEAEAGKPDPNNFASHAEYVEALTDWKIEQREKKAKANSQREQVQTEHQKAVQTYLERKESFSAKTPDFEDVIADVDDVPAPIWVQNAIIRSENGPELAYEMAKNKAEFARICKLPHDLALMEIGTIKAKLASKNSSEPESKKITNAPKPLEPVGSGKGASTKKSLDDPDLSFSEYERMRREQMKRRRA